MAFVAHGVNTNPFVGRLQLSLDLPSPAASVVTWQILLSTTDWASTPFFHTDGIQGAPNSYTGPFIRGGNADFGSGTEPSIRAQHGATVQNAPMGVADPSQPMYWKFELDAGANELRVKCWAQGDTEPGSWAAVISTAAGTLGTLSILAGTGSGTTFQVYEVQVELDGGGMSVVDDLDRLETGGWGTSSSGPTWSASLGGGDAFIDEDVPDPPAASGWDVYPAASPNGTIIETVQDDASPLAGATGRSIRVALNEAGQGGFRINRHVTVATAAALADQNIVKCRFPWRDDYDFAFVLERGDFTLAAKEEKGGEEAVLGGRGILAYLERAVMDAVAYTTGLDISDTWTQVWSTKAVAKPTGAAFDPTDPDGLYVIGLTSRRIYRINQNTRKAAAVSPALWSGANNYAGGLSFDPVDPTIAWALEAPWLAGSGNDTKIRKLDRSTWAVLDTYNIGSPVQLTDIRSDGVNLWTARYDNHVIQKRDITDGSVIDSSTITYNGNVQQHPNGIAINGTEISYWFGGTSGKGTGRALLADTSDPWTITGIQKTKGVAGFGGERTTEGGEEFIYVVNYVTGVVVKYQLTSATPHDPLDGKWRLDEATAIAILHRIIAEAQAGGRPQQPYPDLTIDFSQTLDSAGAPHETHDGTLEFDADVTASVLATVLRLIPFGVVLKMSPTLLLQAFNAGGYGTDRTGAFAADTVRFEKGVNIIPELARQARSKALHSHMLAVGKDAIFARSVLDDLGYVREGGLVTDLEDVVALEGQAAAELADERVKRERIRFAVPIGNNPEAGLYLPWTHYDVGDLVTLHTGAVTEYGDFDETPLVLYAFTLQEGKAGDWPVAVLELGSATLIEPPASTSGGGAGGSSSSGSVTGAGGGGGSSGGGGGGAAPAAPAPVFEGLDDLGAVLTSATGRVIRSSDFQVYQDGPGRIRVVIASTGTRAVTEEFVAAGGTPEGFTLADVPAGDVRVSLNGLRLTAALVTLTDDLVELDTVAADDVIVDYEV